MIKAPIKRHKTLRPLSREHHDGLLLCWKIRRGIQKSAEPERIASYVRHFYTHHLQPHFRVEEEHVFPVLGNGHSMVQQAMDEHSRIRSLVAMKEPDNSALDLLQQQLEKHIRFEERVMFQEIQ